MRVVHRHADVGERIDEVAQGRVWSGRQAIERGLLDQLGSYTDALKAAAARARLPADAPIVYFEREPRSLDRMISLLAGQVGGMLQRAFGLDLTLWSGRAPDHQVQRDLQWLRQTAADPFVTLAHCLCGAP